MIIRKQKKLNKMFYTLLLVSCSLISCKIRKEIDIKRIIKGVVVENLHNYTFNNDSNSIYIIDNDTVSIRYVSEYDNTGSLVKFSMYKFEGILEYSKEELEKDTLLLDLTGGKNIKNWKFISNNEITNKKDTLKIKISKNIFGKNIFVDRKGSTIVIFE